MSKKFLNTKTMILCSLFTALIAIGAFIRIPFPVTVFSFQFTFVLLAGVLLGAKRGGLSTLVYVLIGLVGFPIFTEGGGPQYILKPTFGYLLAFIITAYLVGYFREKLGTGSFIKLFLACLLGMAFTYGFGSMYTYFILNYALGTKISYLACLVSLFPFAFIKDMASCALAVFVGQRLARYIEF